MMKKKVLFVTVAIFLCGCGNIKTDASQEASELTAFPTSAYIDTSDLTYTGDYSMEMYKGYSFEGDDNQTLTQYFDGYRSKDGETFVFDERNRLRFYSCEQFEENKECALSEEKMRERCDEVLAEFIQNYDEYEYSSSNYSPGSIVPYELVMLYETDSASNGAVITLNPSGAVAHMNISYYDIPGESIIDHAYFDSKFDEKIKEYEQNGDIHHYTVDNEKYYLVDDSVYAIYTVTFYDNPVSEEGEYSMFCEGFGFAKKLE